MSVSESDVQDILETDFSTDGIEPFLNDVKNSDATESLNDRATKWFAAHLVSMKDRRKSKEKVGPVSVTYSGDTGMGLKSTRYGQMALIFDNDNVLKNLDKDEAIFEVY